jgi:hypothetical protein
MTAMNQNFTMFSGDSLTIVIPVKKGDGTLLSLGGCTIKWALKEKDISPVPILLKTTESGISTATGEVSIKLDPADTSELAGTFYHECEITDPLGNVSTVSAGYAAIQHDGV